jgi:cytochrome oxidase Cu insertion factor (SCO1/SenC/PrrC family)
MRFPFLLLIGVLVSCAGCQTPPDDHTGIVVTDFHLTERNGQPVTNETLKGRVWLGAFIFTRCTNTCPQFSGAMGRLQQELAQYPDFLLVSFALDPEHDTPPVLQAYASRFGADANRWFFLTGDRATMHKLSQECFKLAVEANKGTARTPGNEFMHQPRAFLVDKRGEIRGYYDLRNDHELTEIRKKVAYLVREKP